MISQWAALNSSGSGMNTATITTATAPTANELNNFFSLPKGVRKIIVHYLPVAAVISLLATSSDWQLGYLWLFSVDGKKQVRSIIEASQSTWSIDQAAKCKGSVAKETFNRVSTLRAPHYLLAGPGGEPLYEQHHNVAINFDSALVKRLRTGTSPISASELGDRQRRWKTLITSWQNNRITRRPPGPTIAWLDWQITTAGLELQPTLTKMILDESLPLSSLESCDRIILEKFASMLKLPCIASALDRNEVSISELWFLVSESASGDRSNFLELIKSKRVQNILDEGQLQLGQFINPWLAQGCPGYDIMETRKLFLNDAIGALFDKKVLTATQLLGFVNDLPFGCYWALYDLLEVFEVEGAKQHFMLDDALCMQLMNLRHKDCAYKEKTLCLRAIFSTLRDVLQDPLIKKHLINVEQGKQCLQKIIDLACQQGPWDDRLKELFALKDYHYFLDTDEVDPMDQLFHCPGLLKLDRALHTQVIQDCIEMEGGASKLSLLQLIDLIVKEGEDPTNRQVLGYFLVEIHGDKFPYYREFYSLDMHFFSKSEKESYIDPTDLPFVYPKIALALMNPAVKQQLDEGKFNLQELSEKLKGDPSSGHLVALFGLSGKYSTYDKARATEDFMKHYLEASLNLDMDDAIRIIRENRQLAIHSAYITFFDIIKRLDPLFSGNLITVQDLFDASDELIAQLCNPELISQVENMPDGNYFTSGNSLLQSVMATIEVNRFIK